LKSNNRAEYHAPNNSKGLSYIEKLTWIYLRLKERRIFLDPGGKKHLS